MLYFFSQRLERHHVEKENKKCTVGVVCLILVLLAATRNT